MTHVISQYEGQGLIFYIDKKGEWGDRLAASCNMIKYMISTCDDWHG
jgi:hypothetical protein